MPDTTSPFYLSSPFGTLPANASIRIEMNEYVKAGTGFITFTDSEGHSQSFDVASSAVRFFGTVAVIDPPFDLVEGKTYTIAIPAGAIVDLAGNAAPSTSGTITAVAADTSAPTLVSTRGASGGGVFLRFSEPVTRGTGTIAIHNADGSIFCQYDITDTTHVAMNYDWLSLRGVPDFVNGANYYVTIDAGAITDYSNNPLAAVTSPSTLPFSSDSTAPGLTNTYPYNNFAEIAVDANIVLTYSEAVAAGTGNVVITATNGGAVIETIAITDTSKVTISGNTVTINPATTLAYFSYYKVTVPAGVVTDLAGNPTPNAETINFTTQWDPNEKIAPTLTSSTPAAGASLVDHQSNITLTFSEPINIGTGFISIYSADGTLAAKINVTDSNQVSLYLGVYGKQVVINPTADLVQGVSYYVLIDSGAFVDLAGNAYAGITSPSTLTFATTPVPPPEFLNLSASNGIAKAATTGTLTLAFTKTVAAGTGTLRIYKASDNSLFTTISIADASQVTIDGANLTIDPAVNFDPLTDYYVVYDAGLVVDSGGRQCSAVTSPAAIDFKTGAGAPMPFTIAAGQTVNYVLTNADGFNPYRSDTDPNNFNAEVKGFANHGTVAITSTYANTSIVGYYVYGPSIWYDGAVVNDGELRIDAPNAGYVAGFSYGMWGPQFTNTVNGKIVVSGATAKGLVLYDPTPARTPVNAGLIQVDGATEAYGVDLQNSGTSLINSGTITVHSGVGYDPTDDVWPFRAIAVRTNGYLVNSGTISCSADTYSQYAIGVVFNYCDSIAASYVENTGTIKAPIAILEATPNYSGTSVTTVRNSGTIEGRIMLAYGNDGLENSGTITGVIEMGQGDNVVTNSGAITGAIYLDAGDDVYKSLGGTVNGFVYGGSGKDTAIFSGKLSDYAIDYEGTKTTVTGAGKTTTLYFFETLKFDDSELNLADSKLSFNVEPILVYNDITIRADETYYLYSAGWNRINDTLTLLTHSFTSSPSLHNLGTILAASEVDGDIVAGISGTATTSFSGSHILNDGLISVVANDSSLATAIITTAFLPAVNNSATGRLEAEGGAAAGIWTYSPSNPIANAGTISATGTHFAVGLNLFNCDYTVANTGTITVHSGNGASTAPLYWSINPNQTGAFGILVHGSGDIITNSGQIVVTADQHSDQTVGIAWNPASFRAETITNTGLISASIALLELSSGNDPSALKSAIDNAGTIQGDIQLSLGSDVLKNTGTITGNVALGADHLVEDWQTDDDTFDGRGGTLTGTLHGNLGADTIWAGAGNASYFGDAGDDFIAAGTGTETLDGGNGIDTLSFSSATGNVTVNLALGSVQSVGGNIGLLTFANFESLAGSSFNDTLTGDGAANTIWGAAGCDLLYGGAGADTLYGGDDGDTLTGGAGDDTLEGGSNVDIAIFSGNKAAYTITQTSTGVFQVTGPDGTDILKTIEYAKFDDQTIRLLPGTGTTINWSADPSTYMTGIRDFDGNDLGSAAGWKLIGTADVNGDGTAEHILVNRQNGRWAEISTEADGKTYFGNSGWAGDTRVVGIYIDPLVTAGIVQAGGDEDSQRRFQNDLNIENIHGILGQNDYNHDGLQEIYFSLTDGTAYLHAYMHADGNIQYANYQNEQQVKDYLTSNGFTAAAWAGWFPSGQTTLAAVVA